MHFRVPLLAAVAFGLVACADRAPTAVDPGSLAPTAAPSLDKLTTSTEVPGARLVLGNISGNGNAVCAAVAPSGATWLGFKVDGADNSTVGGYQFTVSSDGQYLSYQPIAGQQQVTLVAVVVKGGPNTFVYAPPLGPGKDMRSPDNGGGNIPGISHYTVCYTPPAPWTVDKKLVMVYKEGMVPITPFNPQAPVVIQKDQFRWLEFEITVTGPQGATARLTDLTQLACPSAAADDKIFTCYLPPEYGAGSAMLPIYFSTTDGKSVLETNFSMTSTTMKFTIIIDVLGLGCGKDYNINNPVRLTTTGGTLLAPQASAFVDIQTTCP